MPFQKGAIPDVVRAALTPTLRQTIDQETCTIRLPLGHRAAYYERWFRAMQTAAALDTVVALTPEHPLYGRGLWWTLRFSLEGQGPEQTIVVTKITEAEAEANPSDTIICIGAAFRNQVFAFKTPSQRAYLRRKQQLERTIERLIKRAAYPELKGLVMHRDLSSPNTLILSAIPFDDDIILGRQ